MKPFKNILLLALITIICSPHAFAQQKKNARRGNTEQTLINRLEACLSRKDAYCYIALWPDMDTLSKTILEYADKKSREYQEMQQLQDNPVLLMHADSIFKANLKISFDSVIANGEAQGIHWESIVPLRYELVKQRQTRNELSEKLAPTRFVGYLFFTDLASRRIYGLMVGDILQIKNEWYGGHVRELYEGRTRDEWEEARYQSLKEKKAGRDSLARDSTKTPATEDEASKAREKIVVERKFYSGMFDNEIPVQLYIRSLKGGCPTGICSWEAIYKFGDQDDYILLEVAKMPDGKFQMTEVPPNGVLDLELKDKLLFGTWTSADNQTGYDAKFTEIPASAKKVQRLDGILMQLKGPK